MQSCPCVTCVAKLAGYVPEKGCLHALPAVVATASEQNLVSSAEPFVWDFSAEGDSAEVNQSAIRLALRTLKAFFYPMPASIATNRWLIDVTRHDLDNVLGLTGISVMDPESDRINFDVPGLDADDSGNLQVLLQELLRWLAGCISSRS